MAIESLFADVIVPLAMPRALTYSVPPEMESVLRPGHRVLVLLAGRHYYTGIVRRLHTERPEGYDIVPIHTLMDDRPVVNETELRLWDWMSDYYMCTPGEVMAAALPGTLLLASETKLVLKGDYRGAVLSQKELLVCEALEVRKTMTLAEIAELLGVKSIQPVVKALIEKGLVVSEEDLTEKYKPKVIQVVGLTHEFAEESLLISMLDSLEKKSPKQAALLLALLAMPAENGFVPKSELLKKADVASSVLKSLEEKGVVRIEDRVVDRLQSSDEGALRPVVLSEMQQTALDDVKAGWDARKAVLLEGVTGSGKTEIYAKLIEEAVARGEQVLFLLPEIALTAQMIQRLKAIFGDKIGLYHSKFSQNERTEIRQKVLEGGERFSIILGARSALLLPFPCLGLIIVDEEHEPSYKQHDPAPRYHARDTALVLAGMHGARVVLGSATPSVETSHNAERGLYHRVVLSERYSKTELPEIELVDLRSELKFKSMKGIFSSALFEGIKRALDEGEKVILFQNRRGYSSLWQCTICGHTPECVRCDVSMTYHKQNHMLRCHYCGHKDKPPVECPACSSTQLRMIGFGTERVEEELQTWFPEARFVRMDLDTARTKHAHHELIEQFASGETDVLIGTQMVSKGLDFKNVALVGILNADLLWKFPDFRSHERAFQLMVQVAGRAGRQDKRGRVIIQTYDPEFWLLQYVRNHDYRGFLEKETEERRLHGYPPFFRIIKIRILHKNQLLCDRAADEYAALLRQEFGSRVLGPEYHFIPRIRDRYVKNILIKIERAADHKFVRNKIRELNARFAHVPELRNVRIIPDADPV
jgi:primosomal protein N' (replication factor Y) (superfamily II helicase)